MKTAIRTAVAVVATAAAIGMIPVKASAFMGEDGAPPAGRHFKKMAAELGLTSQQKQEIKAVFKKNQPEAQPQRQQLMTERRALRSLVQADTIDEAAIRAQSAKVAAIEADLAVERAHVAQQVRGILSPEQLRKFKELQAKRDRKMEEFRSRASERIEKE